MIRVARPARPAAQSHARHILNVLGLIRWANGPTNSTQGAKRGQDIPRRSTCNISASATEHITQHLQERFQMIHDAVKAETSRDPIIGTVGPFHSGGFMMPGWKIANELNLAMVDEHYYEARMVLE